MIMFDNVVHLCSSDALVLEPQRMLAEISIAGENISYNASSHYTDQCCIIMSITVLYLNMVFGSDCAGSVKGIV